MTCKDTLEPGLKEDRSYRRDNLPPNQMPPPELPGGPRRDPGISMSGGERTRVEPPAVDTVDDLPPQD